MVSKADADDVFERFWNRTTRTVTTVQEFDTREGRDKVLWRHNDGRTLLVTGVTEHRVTEEVFREVEHRYAKEQYGLCEGVDIYDEKTR